MAERIDLHNSGDIREMSAREIKLEAMAAELRKHGYVVIAPAYKH